MPQTRRTSEELYYRVKEYKNDSTIEHYIHIITKIMTIAQPYILVNIENPSKSIFDIDEKSKEAVAYWKSELDKYVEKNYSDLINRNENN